jgi:glycosyltransferase involved in cell wall biosynthesis
MIISAFSMVRNATKLYYPIKASIESILPIVDEFIIALGDCDEDDHTLEEIEKIKSDKIKIIHTKWNIETYTNGAEYAHQTDIAKGYCKGDWLFYLQSDEVIHEKYLSPIKIRCNELLNNKSVEGLLFDYRHFL